MTEILVAGHKNPDMDCTCAATAYAHLKQHIDPNNRYIAIRTGGLSPQIRDIYEFAGVTPPQHRETVAPSVGQVVKPTTWPLPPQAPVLEAFRLIQERTISAIPVLTEGNELLGVVGVNDVVAYALAQNQPERPVYRFQVENFTKVLPGHLVQAGSQSSFTAAIMTGSMPLEVTIRRLASLDFKPVLVVGNRTEIVQFAVENQLPALIITGVSKAEEIAVDFSDYNGALFISGTDTAESIRLVRLSTPVEAIMATDGPTVDVATPFDEAKALLVNSDYRGLPVFDGERFAGMVTRRSFIERPHSKLVLVDHNETRQAVDGAEEAEILEILDHHRLSAPTTPHPISVSTRPVGSTCTLVWEEFRRTDTDIPREIAILLLSGIVSDTVNLNSPTTTGVDRAAVRELEEITGLRAEDHAKRLFAQLQALQHRDPMDTVSADFKTYKDGGVNFGIGQVEVTTLSDSEAYRDRLISALQTIAGERGLRWTMLMVTDVIKQNSLLLTSGFAEAERKLPYHKETDKVYSLPGVLSRKKQLLPEVVRVLSELK